jgi:hypothetical protein
MNQFRFDQIETRIFIHGFGLCLRDAYQFVCGHRRHGQDVVPHKPPETNESFFIFPLSDYETSPSVDFCPAANNSVEVEDVIALN